MTTDVFEIIGELVKKLLHDQDLVENEREIINSLKKKGYDVADINRAFEFIFSSSNNAALNWEAEVELNDEQETEEKDWGLKNRVFDTREKFKLDLDVQGIIFKLLSLDLVNEQELEKSIARAISQPKSELDILEFWQVLEEVIDDELRLTMIIEKIPEFKIATAGSREQFH